MRLKRHLARERLARIRHRAHHAALRLVQPNLRIVPAGASATCGTVDANAAWFDCAPGRRSSERVPVADQVSVRRFGAFPFDCRLSDVSLGGCRVELIEAAEPSERVIARLPGLEPFGARIAWTEHHSAGIAFDKEMHPAVFDHLLSRLD